jgi:hypothetical protein
MKWYGSDLLHRKTLEDAQIHRHAKFAVSVWKVWDIHNEKMSEFVKDIQHKLCSTIVPDNIRDAEVMSCGDPISVILLLAKEVKLANIPLPLTKDLSTIHEKIASTTTNLFSSLQMLMDSNSPSELLGLIYGKKPCAKAR